MPKDLNFNETTVKKSPMQDFASWLNRKKQGPKPKKPMPKKTAARAREDREYARKKKAYLELHPFCQIYIKRFGLNEADIIMMNGAYCETTFGGMRHWKTVPLATQIHHTKKPKCKYLNDISTWLSACFDQHDWVENHKDLARQLGLLCNN